MKGLKTGEKLKKTGAARGVMGLALVLCVLLAGFGRTAPENPMESREAEASRMYLTSSTLAMDQEQLAGVENANINSGESGSEAEQEEEEEQQEQQETAQPQEEQQQEKQQEQQPQQGSTYVNQPVTSDTLSGSLLSLIQKNQTSSSTGSDGSGSDGPGEGSGEGGGSGGGETGNLPTEGGEEKTLNAEQAKELFTTSLRDCQVTEQDYSFTISLTEKGLQLDDPRFTVFVNGAQQTAATGDNRIRLQEGANSVYVMLKFRARENTTVDEYTACTKVYTITYIPEGTVSLRVVNARTGEDLPDGGTLTVYQESFWVEVIAEKNTGGTISAVSSRVRLGGVPQSADSDGIYRLSLTPGDQNLLRVVADVSGTEQKTFTCTLVYQTGSFMVRFDGPSARFSETFSNDRSVGDKVFKGLTAWTYASESSDFSVRLTYSKNTGKEQLISFTAATRNGTVDLTSLAGGDNYATVALDTSQPTVFEVVCLDSDGERQWYQWEITFQRQTPSEGSGNNEVRIEIDLADGETVRKNPKQVGVKVHDSAGNWLDQYGTDFQVYLNGEYLNFDSIAYGTAEYVFNLYLTEGANTLYVRAVDANQYTAEKTLTIYFDPEEQSMKIHLIMSAETVGLGTMIDEYVMVSSGKSVAEVIEERLAAYGYTTIHDGSPSGSDYWLRHIQKQGILEGWSISEEERSLLEEEGFWLDENPASLDSLGEKDFTSGSGWMVTVNHQYIALGMGTWALRDGDEIHLLYTLDVGNDVGVEVDTGVYG